MSHATRYNRFDKKKKKRKRFKLPALISYCAEPSAPHHPPLCLSEKVKVNIEKPSLTHLLPEGWLSLYPPLGALKLSPALALPLLAKIPPRVNSLLEEE